MSKLLLTLLTALAVLISCKGEDMKLPVESGIYINSSQIKVAFSGYDVQTLIIEIDSKTVKLKGKKRKFGVKWSSISNFSLEPRNGKSVLIINLNNSDSVVVGELTQDSYSKLKQALKAELMFN